ncbi:hypothetical protein SOHN41_02567 [Shewanella sp. HN-41]|nr:hypothetical protein SOHN41_02567 [Shewanella sp. HN-41]
MANNAQQLEHSMASYRLIGLVGLWMRLWFIGQISWIVENDSAQSTNQFPNTELSNI